MHVCESPHVLVDVCILYVFVKMCVKVLCV